MFYVWLLYIDISILAYMLGYVDPRCTLKNRAICIDNLWGQVRAHWWHILCGASAGKKGDLCIKFQFQSIYDSFGEISKLRKYSHYNFPPCKQHERSSRGLKQLQNLAQGVKFSKPECSQGALAANFFGIWDQKRSKWTKHLKNSGSQLSEL